MIILRGTRNIAKEIPGNPVAKSLTSDERAQKPARSLSHSLFPKILALTLQKLELMFSIFKRKNSGALGIV
jgi:hypothetical protein